MKTISELSILNKKILSIIIIALLFTLLLIFHKNDNEKTYVFSEDEMFILKENKITEGKKIARISILLYLQETKQIDSIKIDLKRLIEIEDSIQYLKK